MSNLIIVSNNVAKTAILSASSTASGLVIGNLQKDSKSKIWRSVGTTATITATFASSKISCVSLPITNFSSIATMRVVCGAIDTGYIPVCQYTTIDKIDFANGALNANTFNYGGGTYATLTFAEQTATLCTIYISDVTNTNGYLDVSYIVIGSLWTPIINADYGAQLSFLDSTRQTRSDAGDLMINRGARHKKLSFTLSHMDDNDRTELTEILIRNGTSLPIFVSVFPQSIDQQRKQIYQCYGYQSRIAPVTRHRFGADRSAVEVDEI